MSSVQYNSQPARVALIDSQEVYRRGLESLIDGHPDFHVVAEYRSMSDTLPATPLDVDVVVVDSALAHGRDFELCRQAGALVRRTDVLRVLVMISEGEPWRGHWPSRPGYMMQFLAKSCGRTVILDMLHVMTHTPAPPYCDQPAAVIVPFSVSPFNTLGNADRTILELMAEGKTNRAIAQALYFSESSVKKHVGNIFRELGCANRAQAAAYYVVAHAGDVSHQSVQQ